MSTSVNANVLKNFIIKAVGADKLTCDLAKKFDIEKDKFEEANVDENNYLEIDEIMEDKDLYEQFAVLFVEEQNTKAEEADKEKEEQTKVKDKNGAGV